MDLPKQGQFLRAVLDHDPARALGSTSPREIRRWQAVCHPDKGGRLEYSQLVNGCADVLNGKLRKLSDAHIDLASQLLKEHYEEFNKLKWEEHLQWKHEECVKRAREAIPRAKIIVAGLERVPGSQASKATDVKNLLRRALQLTCKEAGILLAELGVSIRVIAGKRAAALDGKYLHVPHACCVCGLPPGSVLDDLLVVPKAEASKVTELYDRLRQSGVSLSEARRIAREAGIESKKCNGTQRAVRGDQGLRVPVGECFLCARAPPKPTG
jgi:hypothetical protein